MKTEIIIAARGEMPANLTRTVKQCLEHAPACVVFDGEERGNECPPEIKDKIRGLRIKGEPVGPGRARHEGIVTSDADLIVICDGHMDIPGKAFAAIEEYHRKRHKHLTCCRMQSLDQNWNRIQGELYGGGFIGYKVREDNGEHHALPVKWNVPAQKSGPIGCVIGACYAFRRKWYDKIGQPLQILSAWGGDEEILSLATHIMGGKVELLPAIVGHVYAAKHQGRKNPPDIKARLWANRFAILEALPIPQAEKEELRHWMCRTAGVREPDPDPDAAELGETLKSGRDVVWAVLKERGIVRPMNSGDIVKAKTRLAEDDAKRYIPPPAPEGDKRQVITKQSDICERCNAKNSFRRIRGPRSTGAFQISYARCCHCGHRAQIRTLA